MPNVNSGFERIAHRGASGEAPENTLPAIRLAVEKYRVDRVEIDLRLSRDQVPVVFHDATLERTTEGSGAVSQWTVAELKSHDAGFWFDPDGERKFPFRGKGVWISTLEEVLREFPDTRFCLEIKDKNPAVVARVLEVIQKMPQKAELLIGSFHAGVAQELRRLAPPVIDTILSEKEVIQTYFSFLLRFKKSTPPSRYAFIPRGKYGIRLDQRDWIEFLHRQGIRVFYWTVNEISEMDRLLKAGADGILTDYPDRLNEILNPKS